MQTQPEHAHPAELADDPSAREVAAYVAAMTGELSAMSRASGLPMLAYLLDMARIEASERAYVPSFAPDESGPSRPS